MVTYTLFAIETPIACITLWFDDKLFMNEELHCGNRYDLQLSISLVFSSWVAYNYHKSEKHYIYAIHNDSNNTNSLTDMS